MRRLELLMYVEISWRLSLCCILPCLSSLNPSSTEVALPGVQCAMCVYPIELYCLFSSRHKAPILLLPFVTEPMRLFVCTASVWNMCAVGMSLNNVRTHLMSPWICAMSDNSNVIVQVPLCAVVYRGLLKGFLFFAG